MREQIKFKVNGLEREVFVEPWKSLADVLRDELDLTGVKVGCNEGDCGSCTIIVNGEIVKSCIMLAVKSRGKEIYTIEGLKSANEKLHPIQEAFIDCFAVQCGFCTPGMILTAKALLTENPEAGEEEIRKFFSGNLCRCTGYVKIVEAVLAAKEKLGLQGEE